ncbi:non-lysosomal glucosylceramidase [Elysia marginata]|uniref:Non-lysosomal glucosylceramidase n=1 Tax=Elysia marginata TaxID=1093978 RepID=A0AAV4IGX7_9GAST|nr:non-lysosomal glucosylceramidase [Elysia marginata]
MFCVGPEENASTPREHVAGLPDYGWRVPMSYKCDVKCSPFAKPRINQIPQYIGLGLRYTKYWIAKKRQGRRPFIDHLNQMKHKPIYGCPLGGIGSGTIGRGYRGCPLGGIGSGTIGRGYRGEFCRFQMVPGMYHYHVINANQFIVSIRQNGQTVYQKVLSCAQNKRHGRLKEWDWSFPPENGLYHALYPRAWSVFSIPEHQLTLTCRQVSPVLPHDYLMSHHSLTAPSPPTSRGQETASAVCGSQTIKKNSKELFEFSLSWDMPKIQFAAKENTYTRRYAQLFGLNGDAAPQLCSHTLRNYALWEEKIESWQAPVLKSGSLPAWYKSAIFNELYFLSDGGSIWIEATKSCKFSQHPTVKEFGRFAYLEGQEYRMFNTYDVHHYSSFALLMLWPKLQLSLQYDYGDTVTMEDRERVKFLMAGESGIRKVANCVPHDIGDPEDEPWIRINAYNIHPTDDWKDLNIKFVLQVYRDYAATEDTNYLNFMYPKCQILMESAKAWDKDGDGIIDNGGYADQTFDAWVMKGASSYCGGMWLVALQMMVAMANELGRTEEQVEYQAMLDKGKESFERKLWNGKGILLNM